MDYIQQIKAIQSLQFLFLKQNFLLVHAEFSTIIKPKFFYVFIF
jgi:hypothetical protein